MKERKLTKERSAGGGGAEPVEEEATNITKATWMADGTHWPGTWLEPCADHKKGDHAGILQVIDMYIHIN